MGMKNLPLQLQPAAMLVEGLSVAARESVRRINRNLAEHSRGRAGSTLRPGGATPLWNALIATLRPWLTRRGDKAQLARLLGVPRQRVHDFLVGRGRMPDAERTLLLLEWLAARQRGVKPG
jgi:hypothetical protein